MVEARASSKGGKRVRTQANDLVARSSRANSTLGTQMVVVEGKTSSYNIVIEKQLLEIPADRLAEFEAAARRPLAQRWRYAFIRTYKPVLDDARFRAFDTMDDYRQWCEKELPRFLGYSRD